MTMSLRRLCSIAQAVMRVDNSTLFLVQGTGQALNVPGMAWGNGFVTDKQTASALCTPRSWRDHLSARLPDIIRELVHGL